MQHDVEQNTGTSTLADPGPLRGRVWGHSSMENPDAWDGACASREEAIAQGRGWYGNGEPFWIVEGEWLDVADFFEAADAIEQAATLIYDNAHEGAELDIREGGKEALDFLLTAWARKYAVLRSWTAVGDVEQIAPVETEGQE